MHTIVIGDGLGKAMIGLEEHHLAERLNVGRHEIQRLLGSGKEYGRGPLPAFLRAAVMARANGASLTVIILEPESEASPDE